MTVQVILQKTNATSCHVAAVHHMKNVHFEAGGNAKRIDKI